MWNSIIKSFEAYVSLFIEKLPLILIGLFFLVISIIVGRILKNQIRRHLKSRIADVLLLNFITRTVFLVMVTLGIIIFLNQLGLGKAAGGLLAGAGVSALILGFAFKDIGENFIAGIFLAFSRPFNIGDVIETQDMIGTAKALDFRNTHIRTFDGKDVYMPNALVFKNPLINYTKDGLLRHEFVIGLDYGDNIPEAIGLITTVMQNNMQLGKGPGLDPFVMIDGYGTSTINLKVFYWTNNQAFNGAIHVLKNKVMNDVVDVLLNNKFNMPADIVELKIYQEGNPIPLAVKNIN